MKQVLVLGAGRSSGVLIRYLAEHASKEDWQIRLGDVHLSAAQLLSGGLDRVIPFALDATDIGQLQREIQASNIVISLLPAHMHVAVARICLQTQTHMVTASYASDDMRALDTDAKKSGVLLLNEIGVDPGIDHMSAMQIIDRLRDQGADITGFESFTGGLLDDQPESDNPWRYKFTWNPRNVVLAGQGPAARFIQEGKLKFIPYHRLFRRTEIIKIPGHGRFEGYSNRDSLYYRKIYGLEGARTLFRGTLRRTGYCRAWDVFVQLGATDDSYILNGSSGLTHREFVNTFLKYDPQDSIELKLMHYLQIGQDNDIMEKLEWLGLFSDELIGIQEDLSPAACLQHILAKKWQLSPGENDMIVMWHQFDYQLDGRHNRMYSFMTCAGRDHVETGMARTVGLPVGIAARRILHGHTHGGGVQVPVSSDWYGPVLHELAQCGIQFTEIQAEQD